MVTRVVMNPGWERELRGLVRPYMINLGERIREHARRIVRVDTGYLRDSIEDKVTPVTAVLTVGATPVDYAIYVHEGTSRMHANPFLTTAMYDEAAQ